MDGAGGVSRPYLIGLTGNIATGKSTVAAMLARLGAQVIDADKVAHAVMRAGGAVHTAVVAAFGPGMLAPDGELDRPRLGALVFADPAALARLEAIVHPAVRAEIDRMVGASTAGVVVVEAIKLIEAGLADGCDSVWVVTSTPEQQLARLLASRGLSRAEAELRVRAQPAPEAKLARAHVVIDNSDALAQTWLQVRAAWERLSAAAAAARAEA
jgi:dephospho-CoA kinase